MRINLTKKDLVNLVYMQLGFSKQISENLIEDFLSTIVTNIKNEKKLKLSKFGTFSIRQKKSRIGRNPKTKETKVISSRRRHTRSAHVCGLGDVYKRQTFYNSMTNI